MKKADKACSQTQALEEKSAGGFPEEVGLGLGWEGCFQSSCWAWTWGHRGTCPAGAAITA